MLIDVVLRVEGQLKRQGEIADRKLPLPITCLFPVVIPLLSLPSVSSSSFAGT